MDLLGKPAVFSTVPGGSSARGPHRLSLASQCETKWTLRYGVKHSDRFAKTIGVTRSTPQFRASSDVILTGTLVHLFAAYDMAERMERQGKYPAPKWLKTNPFDEELKHEAQGNQACVDRAEATFKAWKKAYKNFDSWIPFLVEHEFVTTVGEIDPGGPRPELDNEIVTCRTDLVIEAHQSGKALGDLFLVDYKTSGTKQKQLPAWNPQGQYLLNFQMYVNLLLARQVLTHNAEGATPRNVDDMMVMRIKQFPPYDFDHHLCQLDTRGAGMFRGVPRLLRRAVSNEMQAKKKLDKGLPVLKTGLAQGTCHVWGRNCEYAHVCTAETKADKLYHLGKLFTTRNIPETEER